MKKLSKKARYKLQLLRTARMYDVAKACLIFDVSRQHYYNVKKRYEQYGLEGLEDRVRSKPDMPNQTPSWKEKKIIDYSLEHPTYGKARVANNLRMEGILISEGGVASIWRRHDLTNTKKRLIALEEKMDREGIELNDEQVNALIQKADTKKRHVVSPFPGYLLCQDTFEVGRLKAVGRIYMQTVIDSHGSFGFAKLYTSKTQFEASDALIDKVIPYYKALNLPILNILTDNGSEYCGKEDEHDYEILLDQLDINHRRTKVRSPWTNGFVERFNRTIMEEFLVVAFRKKWYHSLEELQKDLNEWLRYYNFERTHQGYRLKGKTPYQVLMDYERKPLLLEDKLTKTVTGGVK